VSATRKTAPKRVAVSAAPRMPNLDSVLVGLIALIPYLWFAPSVSGDKDASEFTLVLSTFGAAHPTGYPIYTILGHFFVHAAHALGATWSFAANAWSAVGGACALGFFHALVARLVPTSASPRTRRWLPLVPICLLLLNPIWTVETCLAEVYSWHVAWTCELACVFVTMLRRLGEGTLSGRALSRRGTLWGFLCGVGMAHHATSVLTIAPLSVTLVWSLWRAKRLRGGDLARALGASLVPLTAYGWIVYRAYHPGGFMWPTLDGTSASILRHVTGGAYRFFIGWFAPSKVQQVFLRLYVYPFLFPALALAAMAGWRARTFEDRVARWSFFAAAVIGTTYAFFYGVSDPSSYFLAPLFLALASATMLLAQLPSPRVAAASATAVVLLAAWLSIDWTRIDLERKRQFIGFNHMLHDMWTSIPFDSGFVFWRDDMYVRLHEYQLFDGEKAGLEIIHPSNLTQDVGRRRFAARHGFDPLAGLVINLPAFDAPGRQAAVDRLFDDIEHNVNRQTPLPVIHFDPAIPTVRLLKKPSSADSTQGSPPATVH